MERYTQLTRNKIIMSQEPAAHFTKNDIIVAHAMIKSGVPEIIRRGKLILRNTTRYYVRRALESRLSEQSLSLLAERRTTFLKQIEEKRNNETTTPMP